MGLAGVVAVAALIFFQWDRTVGRPAPDFTLDQAYGGSVDLSAFRGRSVLLVFWTYVAKRTSFGRHVYAVGGNAEAARRAGIRVPLIRLYVFMISGTMAALGGIIFAARLRSVDLNAGGGTILLDAIAAAVIGGTSLFGGRGEVRSALLGAAIIATIANGIDLVGYSSSTKYIVTGIILLAAVTLDTLSRRRLEASGR